MRLLFYTLLIAIIGSPVFAANYYLLTDVGTSARSISLGNIEGFSSPANSLFENPAGLSKTKELSISAFNTNFLQEVNYSSGSISKGTPMGTFALGYMQATVSNIYTTDVDDFNEYFITGTFDYKNTITKLSYALSIEDNIRLGASLNYYSNKIGDIKASGFDFDVGAMANFKGYDITFLLRNVMKSEVKYSGPEEYTGSEKLPQQWVLGVRKPYGNFSLLGQLKKNSFSKIVKSAGITYSPAFLKLLTVSAGFKEYYAMEDKKTNYTTGASLNLFGLVIDYAYEKSEHIEFDNKSYVSVSFDY